MRLAIGKWVTLVAAAAAPGATLAAPSVYIPLGEVNQVQVVDVGSQRVVGTIDGVGNAHGLAATPDGRFLVAGSFSEAAGSASEGLPRPPGVSEAEHERHHAMSGAANASGAGTS